MDIEQQARSRVGLVFRQKYTLGRLIGSGGMAAVYEATHRNGHRVAIKVLHRHISANEDLRARFLREGYVANKVGHSGAVRVLDDDIAEDGSVFLVMDLLEGETLDARARRCGERLPIHEVCTFTFQALDVLAAAHEKGIVHRDVKPENLFLTVDGALKVLDFGIARVLLETNEKRTATRAGLMIGTPSFMAPEQALGQSARIDGRTDLWAVAATMFALISGRFVHEADTMEEMLIYAGSLHARSVLAVMPDLPPRVAEVIDRALFFTKSERWPDARRMQSALEEAYRISYDAPIVLEGRESARAPSSNANTSRSPSSNAPVSRTPSSDAPSSNDAAFAPTVNAGTPTQPMAFAPMPSALRASTTNGLAQEEMRLPVRVQWGPLFLGACVLAGVVAGAVALGRNVLPSQSAASLAPSRPVPTLTTPPSPVPSVALVPAPPELPRPSVAPMGPAVVASGAPAPNTPAVPNASRLAVPPAPSRGRRGGEPAASAVPSAAPSPPPSAAPSAVVSAAPPEFVPPMPLCNPNFIVDSEGNKIFKPECFPSTTPPL